ncbi:hypothetical protein ACFE04_015495 [Oxalis oulophora]
MDGALDLTEGIYSDSSDGDEKHNYCRYGDNRNPDQIVVVVKETAMKKIRYDYVHKVSRAPSDVYKDANSVKGNTTFRVTFDFAICICPTDEGLFYEPNLLGSTKSLMEEA